MVLCFCVGSRESPKWVKSWLNVCFDMVTVVEDSKTDWCMEIGKVVTHMGRLKRNGKAFLRSQITNVWSVCAKSRNCGFLLSDVYSLRLLTYRNLLLRPANLTPWVVSNKQGGAPGFDGRGSASIIGNSIGIVREPHLIPVSLYPCACSFIPSLPQPGFRDPSPADAEFSS